MKSLAFLTFLCLALSGCGSISDGISDAVAEKATEKILDEVEASINVKDAFIDGLEHVFVTFGPLSLQNETGAWVPAGNDPIQIDLLAYQEAGQFAEVAKFKALNTSYSTIRVPILDVEAHNQNGPVPVRIQTEVLEIDAGFLLEEGFAALIDFDLATSFDAEGNFDAAVKNVQLSSKDSDGDGQNDFVDTDDDNDGKLDHEDDDIDGDGKPDAPTTRTKSFESTGVDASEHPRAPPVPSGDRRVEAEVNQKPVAKKGASGSVADSRLVSLPGGFIYEFAQARWFAECEGTTSGEVVVRGWDRAQDLNYASVTFTEPCGWVLLPLGVSVDGGNAASVRIESTAPVWFDFVDLRTSPSPKPLEPQIIEGESMTGGERRVEDWQGASGGALMRDADNAGAPWNFSAQTGQIASNLALHFNCEDDGSFTVGFAPVTATGAMSGLSFEYVCDGTIQSFDLSPLQQASGPGSLYVQADQWLGSLGIDYLRFD
ncbi:MAG: DUF4382 domain-containing protein [Thermoplasmatota archaeon]